MVKGIINQTEDKMKKTLDVFRREMASVKAGRASAAMLEKISVDYYGTPTPINQVANISVPEPRVLLIQPWDRSSLAGIEKAIQKSDLGINPNSDGNSIRLVVPQLTEDRRREIVKQLHKKAEEERVAIRHERRGALEQFKILKKDAKISEDEEKRAESEVQKLTDRYIKEIDHVLELKEKEVLEV